MAELDGTCAWTMDEFRNKDIDEGKINTYHGYIVASNSIGRGNYVPDENEILIVDAKVVHIIF